MNNVCLSMLIALLITVHLYVPKALMGAIQNALADFDGQIFMTDACRSNFEATKSRIFLFTNKERTGCYFQRLDYGTSDTRNRWPRSICTLLKHVNGNSQHVGEQLCDYQ